MKAYSFDVGVLGEFFCEGDSELNIGKFGLGVVGKRTEGFP